MPDVIIKAKKHWLFPASPEWGATSATRTTNRQTLTRLIGQRMPHIVADAFYEVCDEDMNPDAVVFDFDTFHPDCSSNQPDILIHVSPSFTKKRAAAKVKLRKAIRRRVRAVIREYTREDLEIPGHWDNYPQIDYKITFVVETGMSVSRQEKVTAKW